MRALAILLAVARLGESRRAGEGAYTLADAMLAWRHRNVTVYVDATNLTDSEYLDVSARERRWAERFTLAFA